MRQQQSSLAEGYAIPSVIMCRLSVRDLQLMTLTYGSASVTSFDVLPPPTDTEMYCLPSTI
jgi:hypothetical protein